MDAMAEDRFSTGCTAYGSLQQDNKVFNSGWSYSDWEKLGPDLGGMMLSLCLGCCLPRSTREAHMNTVNL